MSIPSRTLLCLAIVAAAGCGEPDRARGSNADYGSARLALQEVPAEVACVAIMVTDRQGQTQAHDFDVEPGDATIYRDIPRLRVGPASFRAEAFRLPCAARGAATPNYDSEPVVARIRPGLATAVTLFMRGVGEADVTLEFPGEEACLPDGELCAGDDDCCSGNCADDRCALDLSWGGAAFPEHAEVLSAEAFEALRIAGHLRPFNAGIVAGNEAEERSSQQFDTEMVALSLTAHPELRPFAIIDPAADARPNGDGNWRHTVQLADGAASEVVLYGQAAWNAVLAESLRSFPTRENQLDLYRGVYERMPDGARADLTNPEDLGRLPADDIARLNRAFFSNWEDFAGFFPIDPNLPAGYVADCDLEEGAGLGLDRQSCDGYAAGGIMENISWPGKYFATCVKTQGSRGSCSGFAATSGMEMQVAQEHSRWVNLAEQMMYGKYKLDWYPNYTQHGSRIGNYYKRSIQEGFFWPFETQWDYNRSDTCGGYPDYYCSPTTHQAKAYCTWSGDIGACAYVLKPVVPAGFLPKGGASLGIEDKDLWLATVLMNIIVGNSVMVGTGVPPSFDSPDANGFASMGDPDEESRGGHGVHVTGFVTNQRLAQELPDAPPGQGGGYLVVKNSWGSCWSDGGYIYVPFDWAKKWMGGSYALHSVW